MKDKLAYALLFVLVSALAWGFLELLDNAAVGRGY